ncbi:MAG: hypothetical protein HYS21_13665 [Deltaproteobacteria bacterium]|nr:hypothetical protein [Deltaproteobacteria bacterium]
MTDQRIQYTEKMVGAGHPGLPDTLNRLSLVEHDNDGTHTIINADNIKTRLPRIDVTHADFGADPTGVADSSTAIQAAIDLARTYQEAISPALGGAYFGRVNGQPTVYFPKGRYLINTGLITYLGTHLEFNRGAMLVAGTTGMIMLRTPSNGNSEPVVASYGQGNIILENPTFDGADKAAAGILAETTQFIDIRNPRIYRVTGRPFANGTATGSITSGTTALTVSSAVGMFVNEFIKITGLDGWYCITAISGTNITVSRPATATVTNGAISHLAVGLSLHMAQQGIVSNADVAYNEMGLAMSYNRDSLSCTDMVLVKSVFSRNDYGGYIERSNGNRFYGTAFQQSFKGSELTIERAYANMLNDCWFESIDSATVTANGIRQIPLIDILSNNCNGIAFHNIRYPQNGHFRRLLRNKGLRTFIDKVLMTSAALSVNPDRPGDYALVEQNSTSGDVYLEMDAGQTTVTTPDGLIVDENGAYPSTAYSCIARAGSKKARLASLELTGAASTTQLMKYFVTGEAYPRLAITPRGIILGDGTAAGDAGIYRGAANLLQAETGDSIKVDGTWNGGVFRYDGTYTWVDADGKLLKKNSAPISDTDGTSAGFGSTQTTVGFAGSAAALPANPTGYVTLRIAGSEYVLPYYAKA